MSECICNSCKNLKVIIDENGITEEYECEYGFPSEKCTSCEQGECDLTCDKYISDDEEDIIILTKCKKCGKELKHVCSSNEDGNVYCFTCFLDK
jgi:hypothetical protein